MSDDDLIRRGDALNDLISRGHLVAASALRGLPAATDTATWNAAIRAAAEKFTNGGWAQSDILALLKPEVKS